MILAIVTAYLAYRRATDGGRNGAVWAVVGLLVFVGTQMVTGLVLGVILAAGEIAGGSTVDSAVDRFSWVITLVSIALSIFASWMLLKYLERPVDVIEDRPAPPPPPTFDENNQ